MHVPKCVHTFICKRQALVHVHMYTLHIFGTSLPTPIFTFHYISLVHNFCYLNCWRIIRPALDLLNKYVFNFSGKCNSDFTDCDCSDDQVSLKQYTLCAEETICRLDCQRQGLSTGVCKGKEEWECTCITKNEVEGRLK